MALQSERSLDSTDWKILRELQTDARLSYNELGRRVGLSSPAAAERVRRLEEAGVITGYGVKVDLAKIGLPILALIQLRCEPGKCLLKTSRAEEFPEVLELHKLSGSHCSLLKVGLVWPSFRPINSCRQSASWLNTGLGEVKSRSALPALMLVSKLFFAPRCKSDTQT